MKKRTLGIDFFHPHELEMYKKHLQHRKYPGEKAREKAEKKSRRRAGNI